MNIGLVLSGGMAKGAYQIGALRALSKFVPRSEIKYISAASIGVLNAYAYATDNLDGIEQMWKEICNGDSRLLIGQILRSSLLQQNIKNIYRADCPLKDPFYCALLDANHRDLVYKDLSTAPEKQIPLYLKASVAMPVYNRAVRLDDCAYFDGAMIDNIPVYPLVNHNVDYIICIYFDDVAYKFENTYFDNKVIKIAFPGQHLLRQSVVFEQEAIAQMIDDGYKRTMQLLKKIFSEGYDNREAVYRNIERINSREKSSLRITGDVLVTNLNKFTQRLTKRKIL